MEYYKWLSLACCFQFSKILEASDITLVITMINFSRSLQMLLVGIPVTHWISIRLFLRGSGVPYSEHSGESYFIIYMLIYIVTHCTCRQSHCGSLSGLRMMKVRVTQCVAGRLTWLPSMYFVPVLFLLEHNFVSTFCKVHNTESQGVCSSIPVLLVNQTDGRACNN